MTEGAFNRLDQIAEAIQQALMGEMDEGIQAIRAEAQAQMRRQKHGRLYKAGTKRRKATKKDVAAGFAKVRGQSFVTGYKLHRASGPGEAPAVDTSELINSLEIAAPGKWERQVGTNTEYAPPLEFGSLNGKLKARPFLRPAAKKMQGKIFARMRSALKGAAGDGA